MSEEAIADILAEMFDFSDKRIEEGRDHAMTSECVGLIVHQFAKRFEAAWKREREELGKRISDLEAYAKLWTGRADELRLKCDEFYAKAKPVGNAAALREALVAVGKAFDDALICTDSQMSMEECDRLDEVYHKVKAALSAPARNCDKYATADEALKAQQAAFEESNFENGECKLGCPGCDDFPIKCEVRWLFAPAKEGGTARWSSTER